MMMGQYEFVGTKEAEKFFFFVWFIQIKNTARTAPRRGTDMEPLRVLQQNAVRAAKSLRTRLSVMGISKVARPVRLHTPVRLDRRGPGITWMAFPRSTVVTFLAQLLPAVTAIAPRPARSIGGHIGQGLLVDGALVRGLPRLPGLLTRHGLVGHGGGGVRRFFSCPLRRRTWFMASVWRRKTKGLIWGDFYCTTESDGAGGVLADLMATYGCPGMDGMRGVESWIFCDVPRIGIFFLLAPFSAFFPQERRSFPGKALTSMTTAHCQKNKRTRSLFFKLILVFLQNKSGVNSLLFHTFLLSDQLDLQLLYCRAVFGHSLDPPRKSSPWGNFSDGGSFVVGPFDWLIDWRLVNFDLIGLLDSYHTICLYGGGAEVTEHRGTIQ